MQSPGGPRGCTDGPAGLALVCLEHRAATCHLQPSPVPKSCKYECSKTLALTVLALEASCLLTGWYAWAVRICPPHPGHGNTFRVRGPKNQGEMQDILSQGHRDRSNSLVFPGSAETLQPCTLTHLGQGGQPGPHKGDAASELWERDRVSSPPLLPSEPYPQILSGFKS